MKNCNCILSRVCNAVDAKECAAILYAHENTESIIQKAKWLIKR